MGAKRTLVILEVVQLLAGLIFIMLLFGTKDTSVMAWISTIALLAFGLIGTITAAMSSR